MKRFFVYIIYSPVKMIYYIGHTSDLYDRINRHNSNRSKFTKNKGPWELVEFTVCKTKSEAYQLEMKLKRMKNPKKAIQYLKKLNSSVVEHSD
ncbi:MAG: GIY-YIG nuclease family protein [Melioribacteraceae bacterium]|nr:GIY-YIG nuclease family protein [Melioribacteraceae bacterium]MCF8356111.1 GIY-YIG nuclease family protein [Melioribacteraceae bacterium]MCF8419697.1 GIY-YIG nuclease family protein [Melioribacteraceae bacterium]